MFDVFIGCTEDPDWDAEVVALDDMKISDDKRQQIR